MSTNTIPSRRRTNAMHGVVNFPINSERYKTSGEGGMFVKLVVVDDSDSPSNPWTICCGASVFDLATEVLVGDDQAEVPFLPPFDPAASPEETMKQTFDHQDKHRAWEARHFPNKHLPDALTQDCSRPYLASMVLGITGWSGFDDTTCDYWRCTREDLSEQGLALVAQMEALYPGCQVHLLTFLDT